MFSKKVDQSGIVQNIEDVQHPSNALFRTQVEAEETELTEADLVSINGGDILGIGNYINRLGEKLGIALQDAGIISGPGSSKPINFDD